jgi:hypothetical protein
MSLRGAAHPARRAAGKSALAALLKLAASVSRWPDWLAEG